MTKRQRDAFKFIQDFWRENQYAPSYSEIADGLGVQRSRAYCLVSQLQERGFVSTMRGKARSIYLKERVGNG